MLVFFDFDSLDALNWFCILVTVHIERRKLFRKKETSLTAIWEIDLQLSFPTFGNLIFN